MKAKVRLFAISRPLYPDEIMIVDPLIPNPSDRATKLRSQQEVSVMQLSFLRSSLLTLRCISVKPSHTFSFDRPLAFCSARAFMSQYPARLGMRRTVGTCFSVRRGIHASGTSLTHYYRADIVDYYEPTMLIVGSRGLGNLKGSVSLESISPSQI